MDEKIWTIYRITSPEGKSYIGKSVNMKRRLKTHNSKYSGCNGIKRAIEEYGFENCVCDYLMVTKDKEYGILMEQYFIKKLNTLSPNGYNLYYDDGIGNRICAEETKLKMCGESNYRFGTHQTEEENLAHSIRMSGENNPMFGKLNEDHPAFGYNHTPEHKKYISNLLSGENAPWYGKFGKENPFAKKYIITFPDGHEELIHGMNEFCRQNNLHQGNMIQVAKGKHKHCKQYKCRYATEEEII